MDFNSFDWAKVNVVGIYWLCDMRWSYILPPYSTNNGSSNLDGIQLQTPAQRRIDCNVRASLQAKKKRINTNEAPNKLAKRGKRKTGEKMGKNHQNLLCAYFYSN